MDKTSKLLDKSIVLFEYLFAVVVLFAVVISVFASLNNFVQFDWGSNKSFYDFIYRILLLVIGLELARLLITHNLQAVLELIAFVIARKTLKPDITSLDILFIVISFFLLICSRALISINFQDILKNTYGRAKT
jgi:hypothetical protein